MILLRLIPVILSYLLLAAHFSRDDQPILGILMLIFPLLLFIKKVWIPKLFQITLLLGALEWVRSIYFYIESYELIGKPWTRMLIILGSVALFTALSALVFKSKALRDRYSIKKDQQHQ